MAAAEAAVARLQRLSCHVVASCADNGGRTSPAPCASPAPGGTLDVYILGAKRTPIGSNGGSLADISATALGAAAVRASLEQAGVDANEVQECVMGNVLSAGLGQAPARQAAVAAGLPVKTCCTTVNKVCASGMKAFTMGCQSVALGHAQVVVTGGMESMSNVPYYVSGQARVGRGLRFGDQKLRDGVSFDGLSDPWKEQPMGVYGDLCAKEHGISREEQDQFAARSYKLAKEAQAGGIFQSEICPVAPEAKGGRKPAKPVTADEEVTRGKPEAFAGMRPAFGKEGTVTAASSSKISDGAAALVVASGERAKAAKPLARVLAFADAEKEPERFTTAPADAVNLALQRAGLKAGDIDLWEFNEAFGVVVLANAKVLGVDMAKVNVFGGACALGHPIGCSGARILVTLLTALEKRGGRYGVAAICNGGGGATAVVVERC